MAAKIVEAYSGHDGSAKGDIWGDQGTPGNTGKPIDGGEEIRVKDWYERTGGWEVMLECTDHEMAQAAASTAIEIADDDSFGYDQSQRWTGADAIQAAGDVAGAVASEFDCSSLVDTAYMLNGLEIERGYTGNLERRYIATGLFVAHREPEYTKSAERAPVGSIYLTAGEHTMIVVKSDAEPNDVESDPMDESDEIEPPYVEVIGSVNVRVAAGKENERLTTAHDGDCLKLIGTDAATGWYEVMTAKGAGFITNKPKYTRLVTE